jgi:hypothetical protein
MPEFSDVSQWVTEIKTSVPFAMALPLLVALVLASLVDWIERNLGPHPEEAARRPVEAPEAAGHPHRSLKGAPAGSPVISARQTAGRF